MKKALMLLWTSIVFTGASAMGQEAESPSPRIFHAQIAGFYLSGKDAETGAKAELAAIAIPSVYRGWAVGPKVEWGFSRGSGLTRHGLSVGLLNQLWFVNLIAPGIALNWVIADWEFGERESARGVEQFRFQVEPFISVRVKRVSDDAAFALRVGGVYDSVRKWAFELGATFQFSGVR